jgi:flavorubredoxin
MCRELDFISNEFLTGDAPEWYDMGRRIHTQYSIFLFKDEKNLVIDSGPPKLTDEVQVQVDELLDGEQLDYIVVSHPDIDHTGNVHLLQESHPEAEIVAPAYGSAHGLYLLEDAIKVEEGDEMDLGKHTMTFYESPFLDSAMTVWPYEKETMTLFPIDWGGVQHVDNECHCFMDEIKHNQDGVPVGLEDRLWDYAGRTFFWLPWSDMDKVLAEIDHVIENIDPDIVAPSHGFLVRDENVETYLNALREVTQRVHDEGRIGKQF